jgi:predicted PurR-regulated permease PerM
VAVGFFVTGHPVKGTILLVLGLSVISVSDNLLRPVFAKMGALKMPTIVLFVAVFGGLVVFGTWGALMGPLIVRLAMELLAISNEDPSTTVALEVTAPSVAAGQRQR